MESGLTVGVDLGDRWSRYCVLDEHGQILEEDTIATTARALRKRFSDLNSLSCGDRGRNALAVGPASAAGAGHETITAHTQSVRLIYGSRDKNDQLDAERLARLARVDPKLLHPIQHRGGTTQADRALLRSRNALVECRTKLVNHARGIVKSIGGRLPSCSTTSFHKRVRQDLPDELKPALTPVLDTIAALTKKIQCLETRIERLASKRYPETGLLRQVSGVGPLTSLSFVLTVGGSGAVQEQPCRGAVSGPAPKTKSIRRAGPRVADHEGRRHGPAAFAGRLSALHSRTVRTRHRSPTLGTRTGSAREEERKEACGGRRGSQTGGVAAPTVGHGRGLRTSPAQPIQIVSGSGLGMTHKK